MFHEDQFVQSESDSRVIMDIYLGADKRVKRDFHSSTFQELVNNYTLTTQAINNLLHAQGGEIALEARCDDVAQRTLEVIKNLRQCSQYKEDNCFCTVPRPG